MLFGGSPELFFKVSEKSQQGVKFRSSVKFKVFHPGKFSLIFFLFLVHPNECSSCKFPSMTWSKPTQNYAKNLL